MDENVFNRLFSAAAGVWALVLINAVALFKAWPAIMERINERRRDDASERGADWSRIRAERDAAIADRDSWHTEYVRCEGERNEWMRRAIIAEATLQGYGELRQIRAISDASKRLPPPEEEGSK